MRGQSRIQTSVVAEKSLSTQTYLLRSSQDVLSARQFQETCRKQVILLPSYNNGVFAAANKPIIGPPAFIPQGSCPVNHRLLSRG